MPDTFRFKKMPEWIQDRTLVILCVEDFECLLRLAERWLNSESQAEREICSCRVKHMPEDMMPEKALQNDQSLMLQEIDTKPEKLETSLAELNDDTGGSMLGQLYKMSSIFNSVVGQKLGKSPLDFLSKELSKFTSAACIFSTVNYLPLTAVAAEFHKACDNVPNVLVIIKSGQYIAGGYTEVPFESRAANYHINSHYKPNPNMTTFLYSANKQRIYPLKDAHRALNNRKDRGPSFGFCALTIGDDYMGRYACTDLIYKTDSSFYSPNNKKGELFGVSEFSADEYEVYKLE